MEYTSGQAVGTWKVTASQVSIVADPSTANGGDNYLALANGTIATILPTIPWKTYSLSFAYRGPDAISYWSGDKTTNDPISGNNGALVAGAGYGPGHVGAASFSISGQNVPDKVFLGDPGSLELTNALAIEAWVYPKAHGNFSEIFERGDARYCLDPYYLAVTAEGNLRLHVETNDPTACGFNLDSTEVLPLNQWSHVAGTFDGRTGRLAVYINGSLAGQTNTTIKPFGALDPTQAPGVAIGNLEQDSANLWQGFYGYIDDVTVYGRFLSASEVKAMWQEGSAGKRDINDPDVAQSLAKAEVLVNGARNTVFYGNNTNWQVETITFTAAGFSTPIAIAGLEPGMLLDAVSKESQ